MHSTTIKPAEILAAAPDFFALQMGAAPTSTTHPLAESLSARKIAYAIGAKLRKPTDTEGDMAVMARGLRSADFARLLADGAKNVTVAARLMPLRKSTCSSPQSRRWKASRKKPSRPSTPMWTCSH